MTIQRDRRAPGLAVTDPGRSAGQSLLRQIVGVRELGIVLVIAVAATLLAFTTPAFLTSQNLSAVAIGLVTDALIAIAMTKVLISGGFDLSVGSVLALAGMVVADLLHRGLSPLVAIPVTLVVASVVGLVNGLLIAKVKVNPLITTLGMMSITSSLTLVISGGYPVSNLPADFLFLGQGSLWGVPLAVLLVVGLVAVADVLLRRARWLRLIYYVGGNERAALLSGIPVDVVRIAIYVFCSVMAGFAGIIATSRLGSAFPLAGRGAEMRVISACVIGGSSLQGGEGTVLGSLLGVLLMAIINNGLVLLNVSINWQGIVSGAILIAAVTFDMLNRRNRS
ncbi:MAG: ABC transporter permease [Anaerolineales bacterium]|nr:ABC transporter permease [Anaerolineales bacterium]